MTTNEPREARLANQVMDEVLLLATHMAEAMGMEAVFRACSLFLMCIVVGRPILGVLCVIMLFRISEHTREGFSRVAVNVVAGLKMVELWRKGHVQEPYPYRPGHEFAEEARRRAQEAKRREAEKLSGLERELQGLSKQE